MPLLDCGLRRRPGVVFFGVESSSVPADLAARFITGKKKKRKRKEKRGE
jgi:hypothetical protein